VAGHGVELVAGQLVLAGQDAKVVGLGQRTPGAQLAAVRAVAAARAGFEIQVRLEANALAVTASLVGLLHGRVLSWGAPGSVRRLVRTTLRAIEDRFCPRLSRRGPRQDQDRIPHVGGAAGL